MVEWSKAILRSWIAAISIQSTCLVGAVIGSLLTFDIRFADIPQADKSL